MEYQLSFGFFLFVLFGVAVLALLPTCFYIVHGKTAAILETFGQPHKEASTPGLHVKLPWPITHIVARVQLQLQEITQDVSVKTRDNAFMTLPVKVQYRASDVPTGSVKAYYELEEPERQITSYILNNIRQTAAGLNMVDLYQNRSDMEDTVQNTLTDRFEKFGYVIENVLVDEPQPSPEVKDAFNRVIASEREKEAALNIAEAKRIELVGIAKAERESKQLQGQGIAEMRDEIAKGLQKAIEEIKNAGLTTEQAVALIMDTNRLDTLGSAATHGNMIMVDLKQDSAHGNAMAGVLAATKAIGR